MRRPSVLFINRVYPPYKGASGRVLRDLARSFAREGWQVTVITTGREAAKERDGGVRVIYLKGPEKPENAFVYAWIWLKMLFMALRLPATNLVVTQSDPPLLIVAGQIIKKIKGGRHINWCHDLYPDIFPVLDVKFPRFLQNFFQGMVRGAMEDADKVVVVGRCMARHLTYNGIDPKHITMIPNWPDFELVMQPSNQNGADTASEDLLKAVRLKNGSKPFDEQYKAGPKFRVLYAGNIGLAHPVEIILDAAEILDAPHPEIEFVFVGEGPRFDEIARERTRRGLHNIRLMPYQPSNRLKQVMESGDVHLISVKEEAAGMLVPCKLYSALAVKRPCIFVGPVQSEAAKVINDFKAGIVVPQGRADLLAENILRYRMNGEDWFAAHDGAATAAEVFVPKDAIDAWIERAWGVVKQDIRAA